MPGLKNRCRGWNQMPKALQRGEAGTRCRRRCGGDRRHSGGFLLRIMPPSWHPVPACTPRLRCRRAILYRHDDCAASIPKSGLEIKNRCTKEAVIGEKLASIPKSGPEIKNRCTQKDVSGEKLTSIPKSEPEIKNRCTQEGINRQNHASIRKSGLEIKNQCMRQANFSTRSLDESLWRYA